MRIVRILAGKKVKYGVMQRNSVLGYRGSPVSPARILGTSFQPDGTCYKLEEVKLLAPCDPSKIVCLGINYYSHAAEFNQAVPKTPLIFLKPSTAVVGPEDRITLPHAKRVDYECELAVVMGRKAKDVAEEDARDYILGYTCFNDVSDRSAQKEDGQWTRAKGYDSFAPLGPWIETELDPGNLLVETYLNCELKQSARTSSLIFAVPKLVSFISSIMTLLPGDVIATGTTSGVGPMKSGDTVEIKIEKIGTLKNYVVDKGY